MSANHQKATTIQDGVHSKYVIILGIVKFPHSPDAIELELTIFGKIGVMLWNSRSRLLIVLVVYWHISRKFPLFAVVWCVCFVLDVLSCIERLVTLNVDIICATTRHACACTRQIREDSVSRMANIARSHMEFTINDRQCTTSKSSSPCRRTRIKRILQASAQTHLRRNEISWMRIQSGKIPTMY